MWSPDRKDPTEGHMDTRISFHQEEHVRHADQDRLEPGHRRPLTLERNFRLHQSAESRCCHR